MTATAVRQCRGRARRPKPVHGLDHRALRVSTRFWLRVDRSGECWLYTGARTKDGYGQVWVGTRHVYAHVFAWMAANGAVPADLIVCHKCDNPSCVRPGHLFLGTYGDNNHDRAVKERHHRSKPRVLSERTEKKLTAVEKEQIRKLYGSGHYSERMLATLYKVAPSTIHYALNKRRRVSLKFAARAVEAA